MKHDETREIEQAICVVAKRAASICMHLCDNGYCAQCDDVRRALNAAEFWAKEIGRRRRTKRAARVAAEGKTKR